jgi:hypothetical protein
MPESILLIYLDSRLGFGSCVALDCLFLTQSRATQGAVIELPRSDFLPSYILTIQKPVTRRWLAFVLEAHNIRLVEPGVIGCPMALYLIIVTVRIGGYHGTIRMDGHRYNIRIIVGN